MSLADYEDPSYKAGKEQAVKAIKKLKLTGPGAASCSAAEYWRGYNEIVKKAVIAVEDLSAHD